MSRRHDLGRGLVGVAAALVLAVLFFLFFVGPRTGWTTEMRNEKGRPFRFVSAQAPQPVRLAFNAALVAIPVLFALGYSMARPRAGEGKPGGDSTLRRGGDGLDP